MAKGDNNVEAGSAILDETGEGFTFDMSNQEADSGFPVAPAGTYDAVIDALDYQISKSSGNPMWKVTHLITGPEEWAEKNLKVFSYVVFKPDQMGRVKGFLEAVGASEQANDSGFNPKQVADDGVLVGKAHRVRLGIRKSEEYGDGNEVKRVLSAGGASTGEGGFSM